MGKIFCQPCPALYIEHVCPPVLQIFKPCSWGTWTLYINLHIKVVSKAV